MARHKSYPRPKKNIFVDPAKGLAERRKTMLQNFKNFNVDGLDLEDLVALAAFGRTLRGEYEALKVDEPEYVAVQLNALRREINSRIADRREARKREIKSQLHGLKTAAEKRDDLQKELESLETVGV